MERGPGLEASHWAASRLRLAGRKPLPGFPINSLGSCPGGGVEFAGKSARASSELARKLPFSSAAELAWKVGEAFTKLTWDPPTGKGCAAGMKGGRVSPNRRPPPPPSALAAGRSEVHQTQEKMPFCPLALLQCSALGRLPSMPAGKGAVFQDHRPTKKGLALDLRSWHS